MKKKLLLVFGIIVLLALLIGGGVAAWYFLGSATSFNKEKAPVWATGPSAEFFRQNRNVNAQILDSLKPGGRGPRVETFQKKSVALRGTVVTPDQVIEDGVVVIEYGDGDGENGLPSGLIKKVAPYSDAVVAGAKLIDFTGSCIYPGFIELHNHVHYNNIDLWRPTYDIYPNRDIWPKDPRYGDWKKLRFYTGKEYKNLTIETVKWGEIRELMCGTTMVQGVDGDNGGFNTLTRNVENNGNRFGVDRVSQTVMPISTWYSGKKAEATRERVVDSFDSGRTTRYIIHLCEGIDDKIRNEFVQLRDLGMLREELVGIHSTALRGEDWDDVAASGMKVVWSPLSNLILYNQTMDIKGALDHGVALENISFAPDWSPSGTPGMLYEAKVVAEYNQKKLNGLLTPKQIVEMMTSNPGQISGYDDFVGQLTAGLRADITIIKKRDSDPYQSVLDARIEDVNLVMIEGQPLYGTLDFYRQFDKGNDYEIFEVNGVEKAIDITEAGIDKGDETLQQLFKIMNDAMLDIRQHMPFEFKEDVDDYCRLSPLYWPEYTSYENLMYTAVLGKGSNWSDDHGSAFKETPMYLNRDETAKERYAALKEQAAAQRRQQRSSGNTGETQE